MTATKSKPRAMVETSPIHGPRGAVNPDQATHVPPPTGNAPGPLSPDETIAITTPRRSSSRRSNSQQPTVPASSTTAAAAASTVTVPAVFPSTILRERVKAAAAESGSPDPAVIAALVLDAIPAKELRAALSVCLTDWVRNAMRNPTAVRPVGVLNRLTGPDRIRDWYTQRLTTPLFVGDEWKFLRDMTSDDLHRVAAERYRLAAETHAQGDRWTKVALFMEEHDRAVVADIAEDELKSLMEDSP